MLYEIITKGGYVMYPLLLCSVISCAVILERIVFWVRASRCRDPEGIDAMLSLAEHGDFDAAADTGERSADYIAKILLCGIVHRQFSPSDALAMAGDEAVRRMKKHLGILDTIITLAPLLGIFGTVTGIIISFKFFGDRGIADPETVTSGIAQALITTATGLGIAILTLIPYNYFIARIEAAESDIEKYATSLEIVFRQKEQNNETESDPEKESTG
jgi:biopolymer transport protein ExbB